uniref:alpha-N-acetylneuraminide alpha-2,8-sialyltransferase-like n=1 Tax=Euleptes europaea TaxID=460621 RepID=UPI0025421682|nr:alpha-N-acetylneuraminide alpha-2,8-sialyltransferase-like [Euleptes europaea]
MDKRRIMNIANKGKNKEREKQPQRTIPDRSKDPSRSQGGRETPACRGSVDLCAMYLDLRLGKRNFGLGISAIFLVSLTLSLLQRTKRSVLLHLTARDEKMLRAVEKSPVQAKDRKILEHLLLTQGCPWQPNATVLAQYRTKLGRCCNASFWMAVTKENTPVGSDILLDGEKGNKLPVKDELMDLLPKRSPISSILYDQCAVVGNGGILRNSSCGQEIDQADLIVRFNLPPMDWPEDVGTKTSLVTINPSILQTKFKKLQAHRKPFADALRPFRSTLIFIPAFSFVGHSDVSYRALYTMEDFGMGQHAYFMNPRYLDALGIYWKDHGFHPRRLSSGFMLVNMALEFCKRITLYGFWPFPHDLANRTIPHHYYDNTWPKPGIHAMSSEFSLYLKMYAQGVLRLRVGKCQ